MMSEEQQTKPTMLDLWRRHSEIHCNALFEMPEVKPIAVVQSMAWNEGTLTYVEAILRTINRLARTNYTLNDIAGVKILPVTNEGEDMGQ